MHCTDFVELQLAMSTNTSRISPSVFAARAREIHFDGIKLLNLERDLIPEYWIVTIRNLRSASGRHVYFSSIEPFVNAAGAVLRANIPGTTRIRIIRKSNRSWSRIRKFRTFTIKTTIARSASYDSRRFSIQIKVSWWFFFFAVEIDFFK